MHEGKLARIPLCPISHGIIGDAQLDLPAEPLAFPILGGEELFLHDEVPIGCEDDPQDAAEYEHIVYRSMRAREMHFPEAIVD
jgi:hypothetical protein